MKIRFFVMTILWVVMMVIANAQEQKSLDLKVGDTMPDISFRNLINYKIPDAKLSDFKGKLVILDFWFTRCAGCIDGFPKMDKFQEKFKDELQVILVNTQQTGDTKETVEKRVAKLKSTGYEIKLPYIYGDTVLEKYITYRYLPHYIWIDGNRKIVAVTAGEQVTAENIGKVLKGETLKIRHKQDNLVFDKYKPLFVDNNGSPGEAILRRSTITRYVEGLAFGDIYQTNKNSPSRACFINSPLISIYTQAFNLLSTTPNRWVYDTSRANIFKYEADFSNHYCYELITQADSIGELKSSMQDDLRRYFKIDVIKEQRVREVYLLERSTASVDSVTQQKVQINSAYRTLSVKDLIMELNAKFKIPVLNEGTTSSETVKIPTDYYSYNEAQLVSMLSAIGFTMKRAQQKIEVFVFKDIK